MSEQQPLSGEERDKLARRLINVQLSATQAVEKPEAWLTAGQPGSGKSVVVESISTTFTRNGGAVVIDPDAIRPNVPYMRDRIARGDLSIPDAAYQDAGTIAAAMMKYAAEHRRNVIYDGTLSNTYYARQNAEHLREQGYQVEVHGMAVNPDLSHARTYSRREAEIATSPTRFGRGVGDDFHDQAVKGLGATIKALQDEGKVDAIVLYDRQGKQVASARLVEGQWVPDKSMADEMKRLQTQPDAPSRAEAVKTWETAAEMMRGRGADPAEQRKIDAFRDASRAQVGPVAQVDADKLAPAPARDATAEPRSVLSVAKVREELDRYLPNARLEAAGQLRAAAKAGAPAGEIDAARGQLAYVDHPKGPAYQARMLTELGTRSVEAVITRDQTPLARVRELGAAISEQIGKQDPGKAQRAMQVLDRPAPAVRQEVARGAVTPAPAERIKERGRER